MPGYLAGVHLAGLGGYTPPVGGLSPLPRPYPLLTPGPCRHQGSVHLFIFLKIKDDDNNKDFGTDLFLSFDLRGSCVDWGCTEGALGLGEFRVTYLFGVTVELYSQHSTSMFESTHDMCYEWHV